MRRLALSALFLFPLAAEAQERDVSELTGGGRYQLLELNDRYVRLDTQSGSFDLCGLRDGKWDCQATTDRAQAQAEAIAALTARVEALEKARAEQVAAAEKAEKDGVLNRITGYIPGMGK
jgi:hypothetical protein